MTFMLARNDEPALSGPLKHHVVPYVTKHGFPLLLDDEGLRRSGLEGRVLVEPKPGMICAHWATGALVIVTNDGHQAPVGRLDWLVNPREVDAADYLPREIMEMVTKPGRWTDDEWERWRRYRDAKHAE